MQLGIRLHDTTNLPFEERIADVHNLGFKCGHLALGKVIDEFPTTDEAMTPGLAMYVKNVFAKNNGFIFKSPNYGKVIIESIGKKGKGGIFLCFGKIG